MHALADMGLSFVRLWIFWDTTEPEPGVFNWTKVDADIQAIRSAGLKVYANLLWAPRHAAGGSPAYLPYTQGCTAWNDPSDGSKGIRFAPERDYCSNPPHIDPNATRAFGAALAERHGANIWRYAAWNEPQGTIYWPPMALGDWDAAIARLLDEVTIPFTEGVRSVTPDAQFVGPEADHERVIETVLRMEADRGLHLFDAITSHPYSWGQFPDDSYARIEGFERETVRDRFDRPRWYSEIGDDGSGRIVEWTENVIEGDVDAINFHDFAQWFAPGTWGSTYAPNVKYYGMRDLIRRCNRKRRAVRS
jgi:hypothetical protein